MKILRAVWFSPDEVSVAVQTRMYTLAVKNIGQVKL